jgi:hypothetical protein
MAVGELMKPNRHIASLGTASSVARRHALSPRIALLVAGTLALSLSNWTASSSGDPRHPLGTLVTAAFLFGGIGALLVALLIPAPWRPAALLSRRWRAASLVILAGLALSVVISLCLAGVILFSGPPTYNSDAAAFNHYNAGLVLRGINPYTADNRFWSAIRQLPYVGATPLHQGLYAHSVYGPDLSQVVRDSCWLPAGRRHAASVRSSGWCY